MPLYTLQTLAWTETTDMPLPRAINDAGYIVGTDGVVGVRWNPDGTVDEVDELAPPEGDVGFMEPYAISEAGDMAGYGAHPDPDIGGYTAHPMRWSPQRGAHLALDPGETGSFWGIGAEGHLVGDVKGEALVVAPSGEVLFRGRHPLTPEDQPCSLRAINRSELAVGSCFVGPTLRVPVGWTAEEGLFVLPSVDQGDWTEARAVADDHGRLLGGGGFPPHLQAEHGPHAGSLAFPSAARH